jgi:putative FmdB family regulatory protein
MPIYSYKCEKCSHALEALQRLSDEPLEKCPKCNTNALKKQVTAPGLYEFKGDGYYETDWKNK